MKYKVAKIICGGLAILCLLVLFGAVGADDYATRMHQYSDFSQTLFLMVGSCILFLVFLVLARMFYLMETGDFWFSVCDFVYYHYQKMVYRLEDRIRSDEQCDYLKQYANDQIDEMRSLRRRLEEREW